ncbi:MAG: T9SS C-terminal target domain-containing protein [Calditrichaeota bacterium]|nr:MAG: T9SS C-terminal target domain-containing protein [Calditrichota bacterium]
MQNLFSISFFLLVSSSTFAQFNNFNDFLSQVNSAQSSQKQQIIDSFISFAQNNGGIPYIENDTTAYFLHDGTASGVQVPGDFNSWNPNLANTTLISGTTFRFRKENFPSDSRLDYKFVANGNWVLDPLNSKTVSGGFGPNSELSMPNYVQPSEIEFDPNISHGTLTNFQFTSSILSNTRQIHIYLPANYSPSSSYPTVYFQDGTETKNLGSIKNVLDNLIAQNEIQEIIAVLVTPIDRMAEYTMNPNYANFFANELVPHIDSTYSTIQNPNSRAVAGASLGGLVSFYISYSYPNVFGKAAGQSSSFWWNNEAMISQIQNGNTGNIDFYFDVGTFNDGLPENQLMETALQNKGYNYQMKVWNEGHSWGNWRAHYDDFLKFFFASTVSVNENQNEIPNKITLEQNFPNPFNPTTVINYELQITNYENAKLTVFNILGEKVKEFELTQNKGSVTWNGTDFSGKEVSSGIYFYRLEYGSFFQTRKMLFLK